MTLAAATPFFRSLFTENRLDTFRTQTVITIPDVDEEILKKLIDSPTVEKSHVCRLFKAFDRYSSQLPLFNSTIWCSCAETYWLRLHVDSSTCLDLAILANQYDEIDLIRVCDRIAAVNVVRLSDSEEFLALSVDHLERIFFVKTTRSENDVLSLLQKWAKHDEATRRDNVVEGLSKCIRCPLLDFDKSIGVLSDLDLVSHYEWSLSASVSYRNRVGCEGVFLVAGGLQMKQDEWTLSCEAKTYDANSDSWKSFPSLATATCRHKIVKSFDVPYALGGNNVYESHDKMCGCTDVVQRYDAEGRRWVDDVRPMSCRRDGYNIVSHDNHIYGMSLAWLECEVFDPARRTWTPVASPSRDQAFDFISTRYILFSRDRHLSLISDCTQILLPCYCTQVL